MPALLTVRPLPTALSQMYAVNSTRDPAYMASEAYRIYGDYQPGGHIGWDFKAAHGAPIVAAGPGVLDYSGSAINMPDWVADKYMHARGADAWPSGNVAMVDHGDGKGTTYSHMSQWEMILDGSRVAAGQVIGYAGSTGRSTGTHLHFEVILFPADNWGPFYGRVDPLQWFLPGTIFQIRPGETGAAELTDEDEDMALTDDDVKRIAEASAEKTIQYVARRGDGHTASIEWALLSALDAAKEERELIADAVWGKHIRNDKGELITPIWILQSFHGILRDQVRNTAEATARLVLTSGKDAVDVDAIVNKISADVESKLEGITATVTLGQKEG